MQEKRKRSKTGIIIVVATVVAVVILMIVWQQYEAKHEKALRSSLLTADVPDTATAQGTERRPTKPKRIIPDDPDKILVMAEEVLGDEGYFGPSDLLKGFHVYSLLKKCLNCDGDADKVEELAKRLKERSSKTYGAWHVERDILADLDDRLEKAKQKT